MKAPKASTEKRNSLFWGKIVFAAFLGTSAGRGLASPSAEAAHGLASERSAVGKKAVVSAVAAKDVEETGSIQPGGGDASSCNRSRKRLFVEGEGWIVRKVTTCY